MTIQLSVLVWTVICFLLLMLILHHLLFKPVLQIMDQRQERIRKAAEKKAEYEKLADEYASIQKEKEAAYYDRQLRQKKMEIEQIRMDGRKAVEAAREERLRNIDDFRAKTEVERDELFESLSAHAGELAAAFVESLITEE